MITYSCTPILRVNGEPSDGDSWGSTKKQKTLIDIGIDRTTILRVFWAADLRRRMEFSRDLSSIFSAGETRTRNSICRRKEQRPTEYRIDQSIQTPCGIVLLQSTGCMHAPRSLNQLCRCWILFMVHLLLLFLLNVQCKTRSYKQRDAWLERSVFQPT